jgi:hypothetical protein
MAGLHQRLKGMRLPLHEPQSPALLRRGPTLERPGRRLEQVPVAGLCSFETLGELLRLVADSSGHRESASQF